MRNTKILFALLMMACHFNVANADDLAKPITAAPAKFDPQKVIKKEIDVAEKEIKDRLIKEITGLNSVQSISSTIENFLPNFQLATILAEGDASGAADQIQLDLSFVFGGKKGSDKDNDAKLKFLINRKPELSKDLAEVLSDMDKTAAQDQLDSSEDISLSMAYNITNKKYGRSAAVHQPYFAHIVRSVYDTDDDDTFNALAKKRKKAFLDFMAQDSQAEEGRFDPTTIAKMRSALDVNTEYETLIKQRIQSSYIADFHKLVDNQPQINFSLDYNDRDGLVGQDELVVKASYEIGFVNVNSLKRDIGECGASNCLDAYSSYMQRNSKQLKTNSRFSISLLYSDLDDQSYKTQTVDYFKKGGSKFVLEAKYGRTLSQNGNGDDVWRLDAGISAHEFSNRETGNDRIVGQIAFTKKLANGLSMPFSIEYANKSEFLSDESTQISGHFGLKYDFQNLFKTRN